MGNLGTVIRACACCVIENIAIIGSGADVYNPKAIRASMGAFFHVKTQYFTTIQNYIDFIGPRKLYTFMLNADHDLRETKAGDDIYSLIFGNEASGLDYDIYKNIGESVKINHSNKIDSLNLPIAVSIALFWFNKQ